MKVRDFVFKPLDDHYEPHTGKPSSRSLALVDDDRKRVLAHGDLVLTNFMRPERVVVIAITATNGGQKMMWFSQCANSASTWTHSGLIIFFRSTHESI